MEKYTLIVTEKPDAAERIAEALDLDGTPRKHRENNVSYYIANRDKPLVVVPALGHLYTVVQAHRQRGSYPVFDYKWAPRYVAEKNAYRIRDCIELFSRLAAEADEFIDACDYDVEGATIGYTILKHACGSKENQANRMKYSTLARSELETAYEKRMPHLDFAMIEAGLTRHEVDWLYGINMSRALTTAAKKASGHYNNLSTGRVQGPTLSFLVTREQEIQSFGPTQYWTISADIEIQGKQYRVEYEKNIIEKKTDAETIVDACRDETGHIEKIEEKTLTITAPPPFDLSSLQSEAYHLFGFTPYRTVEAAERLYLDALISYPRTSSQKLPASLGYRNILNGLSRNPEYRKLASRLLEKQQLTPTEGTKTDPAHPAIYPTGNLPARTLEEPDRRILDLVTRRFMAVFGEPMLQKTDKITINFNGHRFYLTGKRTLKEGWTTLYKPYVKTEELTLPPMKQRESASVTHIVGEERSTQPPPRYNPSSLLKRMEKEGIGTKATRANTIQMLYNRKYIKNERIEVTESGTNVTQILRQHAHSITSVKLTRDLEEKMAQTQNGNTKREQITLEAIQRLKPVLTQWKQNEKTIGTVLSQAINNARTQEGTISECPNCHAGKLMIFYSKTNRKRFIGCSNYKNNCRTTYSLPQQGTLRLLGKTCEACGWPLLLTHYRGKHPWRICFNPGCPKKRKQTKGTFKRYAIVNHLKDPSIRGVTQQLDQNE